MALTESRVRVQRLPEAPRAARGARKPDVWWLFPSTDAAALVLVTVLVAPTSVLAWGSAAALFLALAVAGAHVPRLDAHVDLQLPRLAAACATPLIVIAPLAVWTGQAALVGSWVPLALGVLLAERVGASAWLRRARMRGRLADTTVIVGCGDRGERLVEILQVHPEFGLRPIGFVDHVPPMGGSSPLLGAPADLERLLHVYGVQRVVVAYGSVPEEDLVSVLRACEGEPVEVHVLPRLFELGVADGADDVWGLPLVHLRRSAFRSISWRLKRVVDVVLSATAMILLAPVFAIVALAVRWTSPGPVFFTQDRIGAKGKVIRVTKFRTMAVNDDSDTTWNVRADDRLTPVGGFLRRTSLDEIPQLLNVLRGEMSMVGPRPERELFAHRFLVSIPRYGDRHRTPVGITGWAQIHGLRGDTSIEERARFDNRYVEGWSLWLDLVIVWRTLGAVIRGDGG